MTANGRRLRDLASMIRSKNAGPFVLTIDVFFSSAGPCREVMDSGALSPQTIADLYAVPSDTVKVIFVPQATALKITLPRPISAGDVGDSDVAGGQQFARILDLTIPEVRKADGENFCPGPS
jgi:hypothetical protein